MKIIDQEEQMKKLTVVKEKYSRERMHILAELKQQEMELIELRATNQA